MKFTREFLEGVLYFSEDDDRLVLDEITRHSRWSVHHRIVFKHEGKFYGATYSVGATESQDESPWEYEDEVECAELVPVEKTITVYEEIEHE